MPEGNIIYLIIISVLFVGILLALHHAAKKREMLLREQLGNLGLLLDEERSTLRNRIVDLESQIHTKVKEQMTLQNQALEFERQINTKAHDRYLEWCEKELYAARATLKTEAICEAQNQLLQWKLEEERKIRDNATDTSRAVIAGQVAERFVPYMASVFPYNPKDARFIGSPIDLIVFKGADENNVGEIIFLEVKTGNAVLSPRQRQIKNLIENHKDKIRWEQTTLASTISR